MFCPGNGRPLFVWPVEPDTCLEPSDDLVEPVFVVDHLDGEFLDGLVEVFFTDGLKDVAAFGQEQIGQDHGGALIAVVEAVSCGDRFEQPGTGWHLDDHIDHIRLDHRRDLRPAAGRGACQPSLVLRYLRAIDEKVDRVAGDVREIKTRVGLLEQQYASVSSRIDRIEGRLERIERRLELVDEVTSLGH